MHGYDPSENDMHAMFVANGPSIRSVGYSSEIAENLDIHRLLCRLLLLERPNDEGSNSLISLIK